MIDPFAALMREHWRIIGRHIDADIAMQRGKIMQQNARSASVATAEFDHRLCFDIAQQSRDDFHLAGIEIVAVQTEPIYRPAISELGLRDRRDQLVGRARGSGGATCLGASCFAAPSVVTFGSGPLPSSASSTLSPSASLFNSACVGVGVPAIK